MKMSIRSSAVLLGLSFAAATASYCQSGTPDQGQGQGNHQFRHHGPNAEFETRMLTKRLNLTPDQASKVEPILASQDEQLKALRPAPGTQPDFKAVRDSRKAIMEATKTQFATFLSADQMAEFDKMHEHRRGPGGPHGNWQGRPGTGNGA